MPRLPVRVPRLALAAAVLPLIPWRPGAPTSQEGPAVPHPVVAVEAEGMAPLHTCGRLFLAGQPTAAGLRSLAARGVELVVDLRRPDEERGYDEPALARELGLAYHNPAFGGPDSLTDGVFDAVRDLLRDHAGRQVLLHCRSAGRVGAVWLAARVLDDGVAWEPALAEARRVGLPGQAWEARARAYVETRTELDWPGVRAQIRAAFPRVVQVSIAELAARLAGPAPAPLLLDARTPEEFAVSHLAGACNAPTADEALAILGDGPRDREVVVYCSVGYRSAALAEELSRKGYERVRNLEGSIFAWANSGRPVHRGQARVERVHPFDRRWGRLLDRRLWADPPGEDR